MDISKCFRGSLGIRDNESRPWARRIEQYYTLYYSSWTIPLKLGLLFLFNLCITLLPKEPPFKMYIISKTGNETKKWLYYIYVHSRHIIRCLHGHSGSMRYRESGILLHNSRLGPLALASFIREIDRLSWQEILSKPWFVHFEKRSISKEKNSLPLLSFWVDLDLGFTALSRIFHLYRADRSSKVGENRRARRKTTWPSAFWVEPYSEGNQILTVASPDSVSVPLLWTLT